MFGSDRFDVEFGGYSIEESGFGSMVNLNLDLVKSCILLTNINPDLDSVILLEYHFTCDVTLAMSANDYG